MIVKDFLVIFPVKITNWFELLQCETLLLFSAFSPLTVCVVGSKIHVVVKAADRLLEKLMNQSESQSSWCSSAISPLEVLIKLQ